MHSVRRKNTGINHVTTCKDEGGTNCMQVKDADQKKVLQEAQGGGQEN